MTDQLCIIEMNGHKYLYTNQEHTNVHLRNFYISLKPFPSYVDMYEEPVTDRENKLTMVGQ